ncbi:MAG: SGNH/GDSL hydrolase family protein [Gemmatimonadales bacterium]
MSQRSGNQVDRRAFLKHAAAGAALGGVYLAFGDVAQALAWPRRLHWVEPTIAGGQFTMVVLGDSIMWGQGLKEEYKFSTLVANWIESQLPGWRVSTHRYAHSGAVIKANESEDAKPATPGEVPNSYPSITHLFWKAASELTPETPNRTVDLVLMDGGINDVKVNSIITTDPTIHDKVEWVRKLTRERCGPRMKQLLPYVLQKFPTAKVVTTSYYPIVSEKSDLTGLANIVSLYNPTRPIVKATEGLRDSLARQSRAFHDEYVAGVRPVVRQARALEMIASSASTDKGTRAGTELSTSISLPERRTAFALIPFTPENAYGAPKSWLWKLGQEDQVATTRRQQCTASGLSSSVNPKCYLAAMGHPNVQGARAYATAIIGELQAFLPDWKAAQLSQPNQGGLVQPRNNLPGRIAPPVRR